MEINSISKWSVVELSVADVANLDVYQFTKRFRTHNPMLLLIKFNCLPWTSVVKCAPVDMMLWGMMGASINLMNSFCWTDALIENKDIYNAFCLELKKSKISKNHVPKNLFEFYVHYDSYLGKTSHKFKGGMVGEFRLFGNIIPNEYVSDLVSFYNKQLFQFGDLSFLPVNEGVEDNVLDDVLINSIGKGVFSHPSKTIYFGEAALSSALNSQCELVLNILGDIKAGVNIRSFFSYRDMIYPSPVFSIRRSEKITIGGYEILNENSFFPTKILDVKLYGLRARLIRLLGWPSLYYSLSTLFDNWDSLFRLSHEVNSRQAESTYCEKELDSLVNCMDNKSIVEFNFIEELIAFKSEMESKYPVLIANPLADLKSGGNLGGLA